jgi:hypothetical protein
MVVRRLANWLRTGLCCVAGSSRPEHHDQPGGEPASAGQELASSLLAGRKEDRLEELPYDANGKVMLELGSAGAQHLQILRGLSRGS